MKAHDGATERMQRRGGIRRYGALLSAVVFLWAAWAACAHAATEAKAFPPVRWTVTDASDNPSSPGENSLRGIVGRATDGDLVTFAPGISEIPLQGELTIDKLLIISGSSTQMVTIRQTAAGARVLSVPSGKSATLRYLTITGGRSAGVYNVFKDGGGILNYGTLEIDYCTIVDNMTGLWGVGGGILNYGTLTINHCTIVDNRTDKWGTGGGVYNSGEGTLTIKNSLVKGNSSPGDAGVFNNGNLAMEDCVVEENTSTVGGGGVSNGFGDMTLKKCTIRNNRSNGAAQRGGGVSNNSRATMSDCVVDGNSADPHGGGIYNGVCGNLILTGCTVSNNTAANGGGIYSEGTTNLMLSCRMYGNTPDQIRGSYITDGTCIIGDTAGTVSVAFGGVAHGVSPESRKTTGEADVTVVENDLKNPESSIFTAVKGALSADLGGLPGDVSAGLSGMNATLYDAFAYEDVPLADASGEGELIVEFTASWPQNVRYYAAFAEYEDTAAALAVKGYAIPERGVQFEIKPGQPLPDGAAPPDFYEEGEGLMTWRNVIADNGPYDHNRRIGLVTFRATSIRAEARTASSGGSGCSAAAASPFALALGVPLLLLPRRNRRG